MRFLKKGKIMEYERRWDVEDSALEPERKRIAPLLWALITFLAIIFWKEIFEALLRLF